MLFVNLDEDNFRYCGLFFRKGILKQESKNEFKCYIKMNSKSPKRKLLKFDKVNISGSHMWTL